MNRGAHENTPEKLAVGREAWESGDFPACVTKILETHGPEVIAYIRGVSSLKLADDIYGEVVLDLWSNIERFRWQCSSRTYLFALARHAVARVHKLRTRAERRERAYATATWLGDLVSQVRTPTPPYLRSEVKLRLRSLRERLSPEEQTLLVLRIDRRMSFKELAVVMHDGDAALGKTVPCEAEQKKLASRLRKRFQSIKARLRRMMVEEGLLPSGAVAHG